MLPRLTALANLTLLGLALGISNAGPATPAQGRLLTVTGTILDDSTGAAIPGALVVVEDLPGRRAGSDSAGHYRLDSLPYRNHIIRARAVGRIDERREVRVACTVAVLGTRGDTLQPGRCSPATQRLNFRMRPAPPHG